ncbi:hypothetical protein MBM09_01965 [Flaviramulus sp. BrNp1-15]|uniref:O-antigen ligase family protein n=1 Tax=Flaviramulus sp. BrNp1-15 TaxID=2916754 RepID=UPI001EE96BA4|nr:O-antigen ligase family protein [Flaviramulus sp. BrNp1-15]ULC59754.1 hypothetical protein MBM09_01965 [Flaviramulus sp. BrNp1-15]
MNLTIFIGLFSIKLIPYFLILCSLFWIVFERDFSYFKEKKKIFYPYLLYVLTFFAGFLFTEDKANALKQLERLIPFVIIPVIMVFNNWDSLKIRFYGNVFVIGVVIISIWSLILLLNFSVNEKVFLLTMNKNYLQWKFPHLIGFHPTYFGLFIVTATIILSENILSAINKKKFVLSVLAIFYLTTYLVYLSARNALICQFLVLIAIVFSHLKNVRINNKTRTTYFFLLLLFLFLFIFMFQSGFLLSKFSRVFNDDRFFLWPYALDKIKANHFILGEGLGGGAVYFSEIIHNINDTRINYKGVDLHNQYLKDYIDLGVMGLLSLFVLIFSPLYKNFNIYYFLFVLVFAIAISTESMLSIIKGIIFFNFISIFFTMKTFKDKAIKI